MSLAFASDIPICPSSTKNREHGSQRTSFLQRPGSRLALGDEKETSVLARPEGEFGSTRSPGFTLCELMLDGVPLGLSGTIPQIPGNVIPYPSHQIQKMPPSLFLVIHKAFQGVAQDSDNLACLSQT